MAPVAATAAQSGAAEHRLDPAELLTVVKLRSDALADDLVARSYPAAHHFGVHLAHAVLVDVHRRWAYWHFGVGTFAYLPLY